MEESVAQGLRFGPGQVASTYKCNDGTWDRQPDKAVVRPSRVSRLGGTATVASR